MAMLQLLMQIKSFLHRQSTLMELVITSSLMEVNFILMIVIFALKCGYMQPLSTIGQMPVVSGIIAGATTPLE